MSNRPSLARKVTPGSEKNRAEELDKGVRISLAGIDYEVRVGDLTAPLARELRQCSGGSFQRLMEQMHADPDLDSIATVVWLARRLKGEQVVLDDIAVSYRDMLDDGFEIAVAGAEEVEDSPEA